MEQISLILIAKNAERTLDACLNSVKELASEIVLVDDGSTDSTVRIAREYKAKIFNKKFEGFGSQKQFALEQASHPWVFLIDSDERAVPDLIAEIRETVKNNPSASAFKVARKNFYFGKWLKYGGKYPDFQIRLLQKAKCRFSKDLVHEKVVVEGETGVLKNALEHDSYPDIATWFEKLALFAEVRAEALYQKGERTGAFQFLRYCIWRPVIRFDRRYFLQLGFLDGLPGLLACIHDALTEILTYFVLVQKCNSKSS